MDRKAVRWLSFLVVTLSPCHLVTLSRAEEVQWRSNYNAVRREAQEKDRPIVIDFGTQDCYWCKRLDATTFRDPAVVQLMNERFVPLKVDAEKEAALAQILRIQSYPTIVIAAPDGKILDTQEGYLEAGRFQERLQRTLAAVSSPEWMTRDYQEAAKAVSASDYARAIALLRHITEDGKDRPVQSRARRLLQDLEQQAAGRLARARQMKGNGQNAEAMGALTELTRTFSGTQAAVEAGHLLSSLGGQPEVKAEQRTRQARELLNQAREDYRAQQYLCCLDRCEALIAGYGDLPEADEARQLFGEIKNNPEWMETACASLSDRLGTLYLALAETWLKKGQPQQAAQCLERLVKAFPGTRHAEAAQVRLDQLQGRAAEQTNFKKP
jgi:thioredoxin-like negative regulator of GroEL